MSRSEAVDTSFGRLPEGQGGGCRLSDVFNFAAAANELLRGARRAGIGYVLWGVLHDSELEYAHALMADFTEDQDHRHEAAMRRS